MMHQAIRSVGAPRTAFLSIHLPSKVSYQTCGVRFRQSEPENQNDQDDMEKTIRSENPKASFLEKDDMSSFGDAYATRSDEEGFGGIYGGNQSFGKNSDEVKEGAEENQHVKTQDYDRTQGTDVKEKEKARHQKEKKPDPSSAK